MGRKGKRESARHLCIGTVAFFPMLHLVAEMRRKVGCKRLHSFGCFVSCEFGVLGVGTVTKVPYLPYLPYLHLTSVCCDVSWRQFV